MKKPGTPTLLLTVAVIALLFLLVRENEMRVAAQSKLANLEFKTTSVISQKGEAIADLSTQLGEMQAHLQQTTDEATTALADRDAQILRMEEDARAAQAEHESARANLEKDLKETSEKADAELKKKNAELSGLGEELRKTTERLAAALKDKEKAESETYDIRQQAASIERKMDKLRDDNRRLEALAKVCVDSTSTADGPRVT